MTATVLIAVAAYLAGVCTCKAWWIACDVGKLAEMKDWELTETREQNFAPPPKQRQNEGSSPAEVG